MENRVPYQIDEYYLDLKAGESKITMLTKEEIQKRPFPGLRPYKTSEFQLFKGRSGQAEELIKRLQNHNLLAVIGSSGTGKSSLVRAGLIPQLLGGYLYKTGNIWDIAICRPGKDPVENLSIALSCTISKSTDYDKISRIHKDIGPKLESSLYSILEIKDSLAGANKDEHNLLIIIDQFEELFRFDRSDLGKNDLEKHFVNLLLKATSSPNSSVYVILTMRSEFLGDCVKYSKLPEAINEGQYLVPQLSRGQLKEVIEGPIQLAGKKIAPGLVEFLINEIEESKIKENLDQLPIMQHALMRTYNEAMKNGPDTEISYDHYKAVGGMEKALANHAEAKFNELGDGINKMSDKQKIAKLIFQAITDMSADDKGGRSPTDLQNIYDIAESIDYEKALVDEVIDHFRNSETSFIMPQISSPLNPQLVIDISHESLMRNWELLNSWIREEVMDGKLYKILNERRELFEQNFDGYIRGGLLSDIMERKKYARYSAAWARRYQQKSMQAISAEQNNETFRKNTDFLLNSLKESKAEQQREKEKMEESIKRATQERTKKVIFLILGSGIVVSLGFGAFGFYQANLAKAYAKTIKIKTDSALFLTNTLRAKEELEAKTRDSILTFQSAVSFEKALAADSVARRQIAIAASLMKQNQKIKSDADSLKLVHEETLKREHDEALKREHDEALKREHDEALKKEKQQEKPAVTQTKKSFIEKAKDKKNKIFGKNGKKHDSL